MSRRIDQAVGSTYPTRQEVGTLSPTISDAFGMNFYATITSCSQGFWLASFEFLRAKTPYYTIDPLPAQREESGLQGDDV